MPQIIEDKFKVFYNLFGKDCISDEEDKNCYGKPCACMVCHHEENFCIGHDQGPCVSVCDGEDKDRAYGFCIPDESD